MKLCFLDIDVVLNEQHFGKNDQNKFGFCPRYVDGLRHIISSTDAYIVVISSWKKSTYEPHVSTSIPWRTILENILDRPNVIIDRTPDLDGQYIYEKKMTRADEVKKYIDTFPEHIESYVILDDEVSCYRGTYLEKHVVDCELRTGKGLDAENVFKAIQMLNGAVNEPKPEHESVSTIAYQSVCAAAQNMADTLRKIDRELSDAAQCDGDYPGGYPAKKLLPELCKIMYSCLEDYQDKTYD